MFNHLTFYNTFLTETGYYQRCLDAYFFFGVDFVILSDFPLTHRSLFRNIIVLPVTYTQCQARSVLFAVYS